MSHFFARLVRRLVESPVSVVALMACIGICGSGAGLLTKIAPVAIGLAVTGLLALIATHLAFGSLEMYLVTGLSIAVAAMYVRHSPWWAALPGALTGFTGFVVVANALTEWSGRHGEFLRIIPADPRFVPSTEAWTKARHLLKFLLPFAEDIYSVEMVGTRFFDPGADLQRVECPFCGKDLLRWWQGAMSRASVRGFKVLDVVTPCCQTETTLNDLRYERPAGFARFAMVVRDPGREVGLTDEEIRPVEDALGCRLRQVRARDWDPSAKAWQSQRHAVVETNAGQP